MRFLSVRRKFSKSRLPKITAGKKNFLTKMTKKDELFLKSERIGGHSFSLFFSKKRVFGQKMKISGFSQKIFLGQKKNFFSKSGSTDPRLPQSYIPIQKNEFKKICLRKKKKNGQILGMRGLPQRISIVFYIDFVYIPNIIYRLCFENHHT